MGISIGGGISFTGGITITPDPSAIIYGYNQYPYILAYPWNSDTGWGTKYSDPGTAPSTTVGSMAVSPNGKAIVTVGTTSSDVVISAWAWSNGSGFGAKYGNPSSPPSGNVARRIRFNRAGNVVAVGTDSEIHAWKWSDATGFGTKFSVLSLSSFNDFDFSSDDSSILVAITNGYVQSYAWSNSTGPGGNTGQSTAITGPNNIEFSPNGKFYATTTSYNARCGVVAWSNSTGFGAGYGASPNIPQPGSTATWNPSGNVVVFGYQNNSPYLAAYAWSDSTGFGTKYSDASSQLSGPTGMAFSPDGKALACASSLVIYRWSNSTGFGSIYSKITLPSGGGTTTVAFVP